MHDAQRSALLTIASVSGCSVTMSATANRPPGRSTRAASANTCSLRGDKLITPLEITQSKASSYAGGRASIRPSWNSTRAQPASLAELLLREVHPDDPAGRADQRGRRERVHARAAAQVDDPLAGSQVG